MTALLLLFASLLAGMGPASAREAGLLDVTCIPLSNTPQTSTSSANWQLGPCVSTSVPGLTSGTHSDAGAPRERTCLELLDSRTMVRTVTWNTGDTSTLTLNRTTTVSGAVLVITMTGTVTSGLFAGDTVVGTATGAATDILLCTLGLGTVSSVYTTTVLEITSV
jgi:hypothetical protein